MDDGSARPFDPVWRSETVLALARAIEAERAYDRLPILADALQEAGCDDEVLLRHCRECERHKPGCWALLATLHITFDDWNRNQLIGVEQELRELRQKFDEFRRGRNRETRRPTPSHQEAEVWATAWTNAINLENDRTQLVRTRRVSRRAAYCVAALALFVNLLAISIVR
jgi:hypothetical protein